MIKDWKEAENIDGNKDLYTIHLDAYRFFDNYSKMGCKRITFFFVAQELFSKVPEMAETPCFREVQVFSGKRIRVRENFLTFVLHSIYIRSPFYLHSELYHRHTGEIELSSL